MEGLLFVQSHARCWGKGTVSALLGFEDQWKEDSKQINKGVYHYKLWYSEEKKKDDKVLLYSTENYIQYLVINHDGKECVRVCVRVCMCVCVCVCVCRLPRW